MALSSAQPRAARTMERLDQLARVGRLPGQAGTTRPGLHASEQQACELVASWFEEHGLEVCWDGVGNLFGRLPGSEPGLPEVWTGSHLDTVPNGGRFDGALGVVAGLEAVGRLAGESSGATLAVVAFRDEEGWRFGTGCIGSRAVRGSLTGADLAVTDAGGCSVGQALAALPHPPGPAAGRLPRCFIELHIEQGPVLERQDAPLAAVTAITGMAGFSCSFHGRPGHAGTLPMTDRQDAFAACAEFAVRLREQALVTPGSVATVGDVRVAEAASNVIPRLVTASVDVRAGEVAALRTLAAAAVTMASEAAARHGCTVDVDPTWMSDPVPLSTTVAQALRAAARGLGIHLPDLPSGAGHDAGVLAAAGVESGMLFVRSRNGGASHHPDELSDEADIALAVDVLAGALRRLR